MSEKVGSEAGSGDVRCDLLHGSLPCRFRAGQEHKLESEAWEALNKTLKAIELAALSFLRDGLNWKPDGNRNRWLPPRLGKATEVPDPTGRLTDIYFT
jgi:hypothetical protein